MAKKPAFPTKPCPKCGKPIHARKMSHDCGWVASANGAPAAAQTSSAPAVTKPTSKPKNGRRKKHVAVATASVISLEDIQAVKKVVDQLGAEKVQQLAKVLAR